MRYVDGAPLLGQGLGSCAHIFTGPAHQLYVIRGQALQNKGWQVGQRKTGDSAEREPSAPFFLKLESETLELRPYNQIVALTIAGSTCRV